ncbi:HNH endonuclease signature motif containing protein [Haematobacter genomosp. 1]|uniref:HNH endonuclease n=1 Tax=Haematobacter genomosp. 1 TaxID=366618 RepID=A0A212ACD6_9RHOB|nr:HNH endonuclease signature motif containing protein [Haematobacter genomosp. 1]OWJ78556.1 HNH endonuclease [Haematobacter genomosp. 1]
MASWPYNTSRWSKLRLAKLDAAPLCEICIRRDRIEPASVVDHFTPIRQGGSPFPELSGLLSLCERCHNEKTASFDRQHGPAFRRRFKGFDADGNPIDPFDAWHGEGAVQGRQIPGSEPMGNCRADLIKKSEA